MNKLSKEKQAHIIALLVEGNSLRATARITGASLNTVTKLLVDVGTACMEYQEHNMHHIKAKTVQCDEIWSFVHTKDKNLPEKQKGDGSVWTWVAIDADTRLIITWFVGGRDAQSAMCFMEDLATRIDSHIRIYTDGHKNYVEAIDKAFGSRVEYAQLVKLYDGSGRYMGAEKTAITGNHNAKDISTNYVERQNLTMRMHMRRFARKTNAFSKKVENHCCAIALHFTYYNFCKIHKTLRVTPAMEAGIEDDVWEIEDILDLMK